jgi:putative restriction endonuclease
MWAEAVIDAILRHVRHTGSPVFTRQAFIRAELETIVREAGASGLTPAQTLGRELQQLRDHSIVAFEDRGVYRWLGDMPQQDVPVRGKGVFVIGAMPDRANPPQLRYRFPERWAEVAATFAGNWILYQSIGETGTPVYSAVAQVDLIHADAIESGLFVATMIHGSYLELGREVKVVGAQPGQPVRPISDAEFDRVLENGLIEEDELLPRVDEDGTTTEHVHEDRHDFDAPVSRLTMLVSRKVRKRQFRKRVLDAYGSRCALTGINLINGGGRPETQAAHIMSVEAGGPDAIDNGIALSGTAHWMFDRGLISLSDEGEILLSRKINDVESVERLVHSNRMARLPSRPEHRPNPRYLEWHRSNCFYG